ncbi:hypothetical protein [Tellurirhabdus rosea]|uniref:hypothetical protein n=1 Tax=Tellurirhabdus rosea TaxID=2674997 RepID=UPI0022506173|nr:hypothetical protein [Tellurirhabdus rosea]
MKKLIAFLLILASLTACKKEADVTPEPETETPTNSSKGAAATVAGSYKLTSFYLTINGEDYNLPTLPQVQNGKTVAAGTTVLKATGTDKVDLAFNLKMEDSEDLEFDLEDLEVKKVGKVYGLFLEGERIGDADGSNIIFNLSSKDSDTNEELTIKFTAKK